MTPYPFPITAQLLDHLPAPANDGNFYLDVRVAGRWDGVLVVNKQGMCIGIYSENRVHEYPLYFSPGEIEDIRQASLWNLLLGRIPIPLWNLALLIILLPSPLGLLIGWFIWPPFALFSILACLQAIYWMYQVRGFPFIRLPVALFGLNQVLFGINILFHWPG